MLPLPAVRRANALRYQSEHDVECRELRRRCIAAALPPTVVCVTTSSEPGSVLSKRSASVTDAVAASAATAAAYEDEDTANVVAAALAAPPAVPELNDVATPLPKVAALTPLASAGSLTTASAALVAAKKIADAELNATRRRFEKEIKRLEDELEWSRSQLAAAHQDAQFALDDVRAQCAADIAALHAQLSNATASAASDASCEEYVAPETQHNQQCAVAAAAAIAEADALTLRVELEAVRAECVAVAAQRDQCVDDMQALRAELEAEREERAMMNAAAEAQREQQASEAQVLRAELEAARAELLREQHTTGAGLQFIDGAAISSELAHVRMALSTRDEQMAALRASVERQGETLALVLQSLQRRE